MKKGDTTVHQRVNITLPEETLRLIDRTAEKGDRSRFIDTAVRHFVRERGRKNLRQLLKEGAMTRAKRDLALTSEWFALDEEPWSRPRK